ncbi:MAG TPA: MMPL family transporter [Candidatus Sulfotelmatobacter sp.]|nr:MMPL family transporter [Candidatus Sulfotelmatobacter sp.]
MFTRWILSHKLFVASFWVIVTVVGLASASSANNALSKQFSAPNGPGVKAGMAIVRRYGSGGMETPIVPVVTLPHGVTVDSPGIRPQLAAAFAQVAAAVPGSRVASYASTGDRAFVSRDGRTTFGLVYLPVALHGDAGTETALAVPRIQHALAGSTIVGARFHITGLSILEGWGNSSSNSSGGSVLFETALAGLAALVVLVVVFGSCLAFLPLLMATSAIPMTFLLIWGLASVTDVSFIVSFLIGLIGLGVAIDYSLLIVMRWREERARGLPNDQAVECAMATAGRSVMFSGATVAVGLLALVVLPLPFLRSVGYVRED